VVAAAVTRVAIFSGSQRVSPPTTLDPRFLLPCISAAKVPVRAARAN